MQRYPRCFADVVIDSLAIGGEYRMRMGSSPRCRSLRIVEAVDQLGLLARDMVDHNAPFSRGSQIVETSIRNKVLSTRVKRWMSTGKYRQICQLLPLARITVDQHVWDVEDRS